MALLLFAFWALTTASWVWLALAPLPEQAPAWLEQTRAVCFGTLPNGLPDLHGWITLAAPIPMLVALLALHGRELRRQLRANSLLAIALVLLPVGAASYAGLRVHEAPRLEDPILGELPADYPRESTPAPELHLRDQHGKSLARADLVGRVTVLTFAYGHCQTVCPMLMENLRQVQEARVVVVTLDPWRDTCGSLEGMARHWRLPADAAVLTGECAEVDRVLRDFAVPHERDAATGEILHAPLVLVLDAQARMVYRFLNPSARWLHDACARAL